LCKDWSEHAGNSVVAYHNLLNALVSDKQLALNPLIDRLGQRLRRVCPPIQKKMIKAKGNTFYKLKNYSIHLNIKRSDLLGYQEYLELQAKHNHLESELSQANESVSHKIDEIMKLREELVSLNDRCASQEAVISDKIIEIENLS
jgi:L-rhamnose mutarotase